MPRHCPQCAEDLARDGSCTACSYGHKPKGALQDENWHLCADVNAQGQRCGKPGVVSNSTHGGRFYCWDHIHGFAVFRDGQACEPPMGFDALRRIATPRPVDFEAILERQALQDGST